MDCACQMCNKVRDKEDNKTFRVLRRKNMPYIEDDILKQVVTPRKCAVEATKKIENMKEDDRIFEQMLSKEANEKLISDNAAINKNSSDEDVNEKNTKPIIQNPKPIPDKIKISLQLILNNFHSIHGLPLHSLESEFHSIFPNLTVNTEDYGFKDWETMIRSPQLRDSVQIWKTHNVPYIKGLPISRFKVAIKRSDDKKVWEMVPFSKDLPKEKKKRSPIIDPPKTLQDKSKNYNCISSTTAQEVAEIVQLPCRSSLDRAPLLAITPAPVQSGNNAPAPLLSIPPSANLFSIYSTPAASVQRDTNLPPGTSNLCLAKNSNAATPPAPTTCLATNSASASGSDQTSGPETEGKAVIPLTSLKQAINNFLKELVGSGQNKSIQDTFFRRTELPDHWTHCDDIQYDDSYDEIRKVYNNNCNAIANNRESVESEISEEEDDDEDYDYRSFLYNQQKRRKRI